MLSELIQVYKDKSCWVSNVSCTKAELMEARNEMVVTRGYEMDKILPNEGNRSWTRKKIMFKRLVLYHSDYR